MSNSNMDSLIKNFKSNFAIIAKNAARNATKKAQQDIRKKADEFIDIYYSRNPSMYNRVGGQQLRKLIKSYYKEQDLGNKIKFEFGIKYMPENISGIYESNSWWHQSGGTWKSRFIESSGFEYNSQDNGVPDPEWITNNYVNGIYPGPFGEPAATMSPSPDNGMQDFFKKDLKNLVSDYISNEIIKTLKKM